MLAINQLVGSKQDVAIILGDQQISGKDFIVSGVDISACHEGMAFDTFDGNGGYIPGHIRYEIDIRLVSWGDAVFTSLVGNSKISSKIVRDATIPELLFAVRKKIENGG